MLLPGFIAAGVFFTLTAHPKSSEFERLIQALIFTAILRALTISLRSGLLFARNHLAVLGQWSADVELVWSVALALPLGLSFATLANHNLFHQYLKSRGVTTRTSFPSEWYGAFLQGEREERWVILHLSDGRRIFGWPVIWPDQSDRGHFLLDQPEWLRENEIRVPLDQVERFLVPASDVKMVEFLKRKTESAPGPITVEASNLQSERTRIEETHGSQSTESRSEPT